MAARPAADILGFNGGYGSQVYAGAGYVVLRPNYRGSTNYGEKLKTDIVGNYFAPGYEDIMTGVDHLIAQGIVDSDADGRARLERRRPLVQLDPDAHRPLQGDQLRRRHVELDLDVRAERRAAQSPVLPRRQAAVRRLRRVLEPVAAQVHQEREDADDDSRRRRRSARAESADRSSCTWRSSSSACRRSSSCIPGTTHGIPDPRNQFVKSVSEMAWMDYYVRGSGKKFAWRDVLKTLEDDAPKPKVGTGTVVER